MNQKQIADLSAQNDSKPMLAEVCLELKMTKELFDFIYNECEKFKNKTWQGNDVDVQDVLYSLFYSSDETFCILNDWDEGENNDPFWDKEKNEHSVIVFLKEICEKVKSNFC
jgi:hypothetical protein